MSRNTYKKYDSSDKYHKEHLLDEICDAYLLVCLERGYKPIRFVKEGSSKDSYHTDYGLCCAVHEAAKELCDIGLGSVIFSTTPDRPKKGEVRHNV